MIHSGWKHQFSSSQEGSVLVTVLAMLAVLLTILLAAMTYAISRHSVHQADLSRLHARYLAETAINRIAGSVYQPNPLEADSFNVPNGGSCTVRRQLWGLHYLVEATGIYGGQQVTRRALLGTARHDYLDAAVVIGDETLPLVATGATRLRGTVVVGPPGLTEGRIHGEGTIFEDYHRGGLQISRQIELPPVDTLLLLGYLDSLRRRAEAPDRVLPGSRHLRDLTVFDSTSDIVRIENNLVLEDVRWEDTERRRTLAVDGHLEFRGKCRISAFCEVIAGSITVGGQSVVDNLLLVAEDSLCIEGEAAFSGIAISPTAISVRDHAALRYPSELIVYDRDTYDRRQATCSLTSTGLLEAAVVGLGVVGREGDGAFIYVDTAAMLTGYILCTNEVDMRGRVLGSVMTERFRYELPPTTYINWVKDCIIDRARLTHEPLLPMLESPDTTVTAGILRED